MLWSGFLSNKNYKKPQGEKMGSIATIKFGLGIAVVILGALFAAFLAYMSTVGRKSTLRQKKAVVPNESA
jgi:hypothetical protein